MNAAESLRKHSDVVSKVPNQLMIGGVERSASNGATFDVLDPATGGLLATVARGSVADAQASVDAACAAAQVWAQTAPRQRSEILQRIYQLMVDRVEELALLITAENGKALGDAQAEVLYSAEFFRWYAEEAVRSRGDIQIAPGGANKIIVIHQPVGVALLVTPWNFPAAMAARKIGPALAAGCTTILKPASETPLTALALAALMEEAGLPAGVVNVLPSRQFGKVVSAMHADSRVQKQSFTGSTEVGRTLLNLANEQIVNCSMELGGNAPFVVFADGDIDAATRTKVASLVAGAVADGATLEIGGRTPDGPGFYYPPTVLTGSRPTQRSCTPRSSARSHRSSPSPPRTKRSHSPTTPSTDWSPTSTPATSPEVSGSASGLRQAWSASTAAWCPTPPHRSGASRKAASVAKVGSRASSPSPTVNTSPSTGDSDDNQCHYVMTKSAARRTSERSNQ